jgi:hypothetical protein
MIEEYFLNMKLMSLSNLINRHITTGLVLLLLGLGNMGFGSYRYQQAIEMAKKWSESTHSKKYLLLQFPFEGNVSKESKLHSSDKQQQQIEHRMDFYRFVITGGEFMSGLGGIYLLITILFSGKFK